MSVLPQQQKAFFVDSAQNIVLGTNTVPIPSAGQLLVKIKSTALNPIDWQIHKGNEFEFVESFPAIVGADLAGEVAHLGEGVTKFKKGDRVLCEGQFRNQFATFQEYTLADEYHLAKIPPNVTYDQAATVPVALTCAYLGLYNGTPHGAGLANPVEAQAQGQYSGIPLVLLGGATSVGQFVLQLAKLSGFSPIVATASLKHTDFLKSLGATHVLDRNLSGLALKSEISKITSKPIPYVYDAVSLPDTQQTGLDIVESGGTLLLVLPPTITVPPDKNVVFFVGLRELPHNIKPLAALYSRLEEWLGDGTIKANRVELLSEGLNGIAEGLRRLEENRVSGVNYLA